MYAKSGTFSMQIAYGTVWGKRVSWGYVGYSLPRLPQAEAIAPACRPVDPRGRPCPRHGERLELSALRGPLPQAVAAAGVDAAFDSDLQSEGHRCERALRPRR